MIEVYTTGDIVTGTAEGKIDGLLHRNKADHGRKLLPLLGIILLKPAILKVALCPYITGSAGDLYRFDKVVGLVPNLISNESDERGAYG